MELDKSNKRGAKPKAEYSKEVLLEKLREIQLGGNREKLTNLRLEKLTGIPRRNWIKVRDVIEKLNEGYKVEGVNFSCDLALPNVDEVFDQYYGKNEEKLRSIFRDYTIYLNQMWKGYSNFEKREVEHNSTFKELQNKIEQLEDLLKESEKQKNFYKTKYEIMTVESSDRHKREAKGIKENLIQIKKGDNSKLSLDFANEFKDYLKND